jgi:hypothetical protein
MNLPAFQGEFPQNPIVFYMAADEVYFNLHAKTLIASIRQNFNHAIHIHLYNPSDDTKIYCESNKINYSFEIFNEKLVERAHQIYKRPYYDFELIRRKSKMQTGKRDDKELWNYLVKTYYACTRFVRLSQLLTKPTYIVLLDVDSLIRMPFVLPTSDYDIHIFIKKHKKIVPWPQHLASTIFYTGTDESFKLIKDHATLIIEEYQKDLFYWFLDQETLDIAIAKYKRAPLDQVMVDFDMNDTSFIWCAKGNLKSNTRWLEEIKKYQSL